MKEGKKREPSSNTDRLEKREMIGYTDEINPTILSYLILGYTE